MLGEEIVPVEIDGIQSGPTTLGHRFHCPGPITLGGASDYAEKLKACHVIVDQEEREAIIRKGAADAATAAGLSLVEDEGLVVENAGLTEWPMPLLGRFDADYLDVPREVIVLTMRANQKYFACTAEDAGLAPAFICVANVDAKDGGEAIVDGNRRVLAARLADARFFWEQDLKEPLEHQAAKLAGIIFHEKLGTIADKVERVAKLARRLAEEGIVKGAKPDQVERAARLAKADLVTGMVGEFPELQGVIGGYLAEAQGEPKTVADAIRDQYGTPSEPVSAAVALADKLDTICAFFGIGLKPTGSKDPFALRRAAIGSIEIIVSSGLRLPLTQAVRGALANRAAQSKTSEAAHRLDSTAPEILEFFADRLKVQQREAGVRHDLIDAVFALGGEDDLVRLLARVRALQDFVETEEGTNLLTAYKRAANILKKEKWEGGKSSAGASTDLQPEEAALVKALDGAEPKATAAVEKEDFTAAMAALASLRSPIDAFFDHVTVNDPDTSKRARRLDLLMRFRDAVNRVADFSRIES
jgi:glycyl-tRNA synthetase beta chain